ncbi:MAG: hypothetical protein KJ970_00565 [Candidatus Eisenbacteria bacterium]|uniref:Uncharacterized protein n=1 Tax=Eiseniibacteriota bacterium TaxID=2212470 RepID=A0A948W1Z6_UNCEI|nr:hypothetical protein [Candidatus Eisenbacteria bacterium]MBU1950115.1 hypothetical protein [Candidatus Eisenbacteria bacterium]MBU2689392.1 hypothetical protein [Candidatus Eisenbacteria bacterium]
MSQDSLKGAPVGTYIYHFPRVSRPGRPADLVESSHLMLLAAWAGLLFLSATILPALTWDSLPPSEAAAFCVRYSSLVNLMGGAAGAFFLGTILILYNTKLRRPRIHLYQMFLLLLMTLTLVGCQIFLTERMAAVLRSAMIQPDQKEFLFTALPDLQAGIQSLHGVALVLSVAALVVGWRPRFESRRDKGSNIILELPR